MAFGRHVLHYKSGFPAENVLVTVVGWDLPSDRGGGGATFCDRLMQCFSNGGVRPPGGSRWGLRGGASGRGDLVFVFCFYIYIFF